ncbi:hypothetical protein BH09SUM1_BH09SUM1_13610 [soil metagenome]
MPVPVRKRKKKHLPAWAYVVLNLVFLGFLTIIYFKGKSVAADHYETAGLFPVLMVCYLAFAAVSVVDAVYDRVSAAKPKSGNQPVKSTPQSRD